MPNISSSKTVFMMSSPVSTREHTFLSQFVMIMAIVFLLVGFCPYVSSSPTPSSSVHNNNINYESNRFVLDSNEYPATDDSSSLPSPVQDSLSGSPSFWYVQPRTHANQFLTPHINDNQVIATKWFTRYNNDVQTNDNDDDSDDYVPPGILFNKRSSSVNNGGYSTIKKRKQLAKPPMEVMNEIVNSIYLKR